ncbi:hypothetical protein GCM10009720_23490 [Yaniella flava]|uniref:LPXTG-motif cell wall anchor domain-containing protein n=1 Tax=Yaniella flava TaxID=287930 RepID=A0ABP5GAH9_9MICC
MTEEENKKKGRLATAVLAGSALAFSSFAIGAPAAFATAAQSPEATESSSAAPETTESRETPVESDSGETSDEETSPEEDPTATDAATTEDPTPTDDPSETSQPESADDGSTEVDSTSDTVSPMNQESPDADLDVREGAVGDTVTVTGSGFEPNTSVDLVWAAQAADAERIQLGEVEVDGDGNLADGASFTVPDGSLVGTHWVYVGEDGPTLSFNVVSDDDEAERLVSLRTNPGAGAAGANFEVNGSGYSPEGDVELAMVSEDGTTILEHTAEANESGYFEAEFAVPEDAVNGVYDITARDVQSDSTTSGQFNVTNATLTIAPETIDEDDFQETGVTHTVDGLREGDEVQFSVGNAFSPMEHLSDTATADEDGVAEYIVQPDEEDVFIGNYSTQVSYVDSGAEIASGNFEVTSEELQLNLSASQVPQGGSIMVTGENFTPEGDVTLTWGPDAESVEFQAYENGEISHSLEIPEDAAPGTNDVTVTDETSGDSTTRELTVTGDPVLDPDIDLNVDNAYPGDTVSVSGSGFTEDGDVEFSINPPVGEAVANADGEFNAEVTIPEDLEPGDHTFTALDVESGEEATADFTVNDPADQVTEPALSIDPERIELDDFIGEEDDDNGVVHTVVGLEAGADYTYAVSGPEGVNDFEQTETANDEGEAQFVIHGYEVANPAVYLGDYTTVVTSVDPDGNAVELTGNFSVVSDDGSAGDGSGPDGSGDYTGDPVDMNGSALAQTGATSGQLGLIAGALLLMGGAFVVFANRGRLFGRKH